MPQKYRFGLRQGLLTSIRVKKQHVLRKYAHLVFGAVCKAVR